MALFLLKQLLVTFDDLINGAIKSRAKLLKFTLAEQETCLQYIHDFFVFPNNDATYVSDSEWPDHINRQLQLAIGLHYASLQMDTPAGTGSLSNKSIDSFSVSNTMAKNNAPFDDWLNMTHYGTRYLELVRRNDYATRFAI